MLTLILSSLITIAEPNQPTEIVGSSSTPNGKRKELKVIQPENYIQLLNNNEEIINQTQPKIQTQNTTSSQISLKTNAQAPKLIDNQTSIVYPTDVNPLDYKDKIENTIYQLDDRLIIIQSIPLKYIKEALEPNTQPTITDYPIL